MYILIAIVLVLILLLLLHPGLLDSRPPDGFAKESDVLSYWNKGICITGKNRRLKLKESFRHIFIAGPSGSGKSQCSFFGEILRANGKKSYVIHDNAGEFLDVAGGYLQSINYHIEIIDLTSSTGHRYNPLKRIDGSFSSAKKLANVIVSTALGNGGGDSKFWELKAEHLIAVLIAATMQLEAKYRHMGTVLHLLNAFMSNSIGLDYYLSEKCDGKVMEEYKVAVSADPKVMSSISATAKAALSLWEDENIMRLTCGDDIDFEQLRKRPTVIFLKGPAMTTYHVPLFNLIISQLMSELLKEIPKGKNVLPVVLLLDEAGILKLPNFSDFLSLSRKYLVSCVIGCQSQGQIFAKYGKEEGSNILANTHHQLFYSNAPLDTTVMLERAAGTVEVETPHGKEKRLVLPSHIARTLPQDKAVLMVGSRNPILVDLKPAYKNYVLKRRMNLPYERNIPELKNEEIPLPYIPRPKRVKG